MSDVEGYVIRLSAYKDSDAMVNVLTENGLVSFLARGVLKTTSKNAPACQLLSYSRFSLNEGKTAGIALKEALSLQVVDGRDSLARLASFSFLAELTSKVVQEDEGKAVFPWLKASLNAIAGNADALTCSLIFFAHVLEIAGYGLDVDECVYCGSKKDIAGISYSDGGFVCRNDLQEGVNALDARNLKILRYIFRCHLEDVPRVAFTKKECQDLFAPLGIYLNDLTGVTLKSLPILLQC